jgi:hypothetical protein
MAMNAAMASAVRLMLTPRVGLAIMVPGIEEDGVRPHWGSSLGPRRPMSGFRRAFSRDAGARA